MRGDGGEAAAAGRESGEGGGGRGCGGDGGGGRSKAGGSRVVVMRCGEGADEEEGASQDTALRDERGSFGAVRDEAAQGVVRYNPTREEADPVRDAVFATWEEAVSPPVEP